jgi:GDPmannose 4,6-dehydratase
LKKKKYKKIALITGGLGQDGSYMAELLLKKKYKVICISRNISAKKKWRHKYLYINNKIIYKKIDILNANKLKNLFSAYIFDEVYNFASQSLVEKSNKIGKCTINTNCLGLYNLLENIKNTNIKFYQASSSEIYSGFEKKKIVNNSSYYPTSIYSATKIFGQNLIDIYKKKYNLYICYGVLFNHESPLRDQRFVTKKICANVVKIIKNKKKKFSIGNIKIKRDWGYAKDYIKIIWKIMQKKKPRNFYINTNKLYSLQFFIEQCFKFFNIDIKWISKNNKLIGINKENKKILIETDQKLFRDNDNRNYFLKTNNMYKSLFPIKKLISLMLKEELRKEI